MQIGSNISRDYYDRNSRNGVSSLVNKQDVTENVTPASSSNAQQMSSSSLIVLNAATPSAALASALWHMIIKKSEKTDRLVV